MNLGLGSGTKLSTERHVQRTLLSDRIFLRTLLFAGHGGGGGLRYKSGGLYTNAAQ